MDNGLEKILQRIENDCNLECEEIMKKAQKEAEILYADIVESGNKEKEEHLRKMTAELANKTSIAEKGFALERRNSILNAKNAYLDQTISEALSRVRNFGNADFFSLMKKLILKFSVEGAGTLRFSEKDSKRAGLGAFVDEVNRELDSGKSVLLGLPANIEDGFMIEYNDVDINCTFHALLSLIEDEVREAAYNALFGG